MAILFIELWQKHDLYHLVQGIILQADILTAISFLLILKIEKLPQKNLCQEHAQYIDTPRDSSEGVNV